jgi:hypothetical protein
MQCIQKKKLSPAGTFLLPALIIAMISGSCSKQYPEVPLNTATVWFNNDQYTIEQFSTAPVEIVLPLSLPLEEAGTVVISIDEISTADADNYHLNPGFTAGSVTLDLEKGAMQASFTVTSAGNFDDDLTLVFNITSATGGVVPGKNRIQTTVHMKGNNPTVPQIITSMVSLPDFGPVANGDFSVSASYTVSASALAADIDVVAPESFQVSLDDVSFADYVVVDFRQAQETPVRIFVRFQPETGSNGEKAGAIAHFSTGVADKYVTVSGTETGNVSVGSLFMNEDFDYGDSQGNLIDIAAGNWSVFSGSVTPVQYVRPGLSLEGYAGSGKGGAASMVNGSGSRQDLAYEFESQNGGTVYVAQLIRIDAAAAGDFFTSLRDPAGGYFTRLYARDVAGRLSLGIARGAGSTSYAVKELEFGTTYLVVLKYDFSSQTSSMYIIDGEIPEYEPTTADEINNGGTSPLSVKDVIIRQNTGVLTAVLDGIRIGNTWEGVLLGRNIQ